MLVALSSWAQGFAFQYQGQILPDGETVVIAAEEDLFGDLSCETNNPLTPNDGLVLRMLGGMATSGSATLQITSNSLNPVGGLQWCMGGACTQLGSQTSLTKQFSTGGGVTLVQFDAIDIRSEGLLTATLRATIGLESHTVNIHFVNGDYDGIKEVKSEEMVNGKWSNGKCFDLLGRQMQGRASSGICIVRDGERIRKVVIK